MKNSPDFFFVVNLFFNVFDLRQVEDERDPARVFVGTIQNRKRGENEMFNAKLDLDRGWLLGMVLGMTRSDQLLEVRVMKSIDIEAVAMCSREQGEIQITNGCREMRIDGGDDEMSATLTQIDVSKEQFSCRARSQCCCPLERLADCGLTGGQLRPTDKAMAARSARSMPRRMPEEKIAC